MPSGKYSALVNILIYSRWIPFKKLKLYLSFYAWLLLDIIIAKYKALSEELQFQHCRDRILKNLWDKHDQKQILKLCNADGKCIVKKKKISEIWWTHPRGEFIKTGQTEVVSKAERSKRRLLVAHAHMEQITWRLHLPIQNKVTRKRKTSLYSLERKSLCSPFGRTPTRGNELPPKPQRQLLSESGGAGRISIKHYLLVIKWDKIKQHLQTGSQKVSFFQDQVKWFILCLRQLPPSAVWDA